MTALGQCNEFHPGGIGRCDLDDGHDGSHELPLYDANDQHTRTVRWPITAPEPA